jgi:hypothetical protein
MARNGKSQNATLESLSPAQITAVGALLAGKSVTDAATDAGVDRGTIYRWLRDDFGFQAELNRGRQDLYRETYARLERLAAKAAECLEKAVDNGDAKVALEVAKGMGLLVPHPIGSEDPAKLAEEAEVVAKEQQGYLAHRTMLAGLLG